MPNIGDLVKFCDPRDGEITGVAIYLGIGSRGTTRKEDPSLAKVYWRGRVTTFDKLFWNFEVINGYN